jgi:hypothetical protein
MAFTLWHLDAVSGSHPPHPLSGGKVEVGYRASQRQLLARMAGHTQADLVTDKA